MINLQASLIGFHNPKKHTGLTADEFLLKYLKRQTQLVWNGNKKAEQRIILMIYLLHDWENWVKNVYRLLPKTLCK